MDNIEQIIKKQSIKMLNSNNRKTLTKNIIVEIKPTIHYRESTERKTYIANVTRKIYIRENGEVHT